MSKGGAFAKEGLMEDYLSSLLDEGPETLEKDPVAKLIESVPLQVEIEQPDVIEPVQPQVTTKDIAEAVDKVNEEQQAAEAHHVASASLQETLDDEFQALFFDVAGLTLAVPLITLGGIHNLEKVNPLIGKPDWFMGVMIHRDEKLTSVDTARWVMPEKYTEKLAESLNYQYLIMLGNSAWGLACEKLINTVVLNKDEVKWREAHGKRPWLAGLVKDKMCALVDVDQMISMLEQGLGSNDL
ncbi:chemotaxis protein CheW [Aestuariibacter salexigens]|uniref:chemotaxis protein CheW n=1 Tax=Aestuariibacter salexigens TaxID=226010 RepID=UPI000411B3F8|nr:chemotaxis protein CheW [Aestuariibacter salexigens]